MAEHGSGVGGLMKVVILSCILLFAALVKQTAAHCGFGSPLKLAAGEGDFTVDLTVDCRQEYAVLAWSDGDLPFLQEINLYSSCIDPTNTSMAAIRDYHGFSFGTSREWDPKQWTFEASPGRECSYYGCYAAQGHLRYYTFSTVSCVWTESAALETVPATITSTPQPTESSYVYRMSSSNAPNDITSGIVSRSLYQTSSSDILPSRIYETPTPSVVSIRSTVTTSKFHNENSSGLAAQSTSWMLLPGHINPTMITPPAYVSSTVTTNHIVPSQHSGVLVPLVVWVIPVVLLGFLVIAVAALITTCHIAAQRRTHLKYAVRNGMFDKEDKIDLNFYPVSTGIPFDTLSMHSNITICNELDEERGHYGIQVAALQLANMKPAAMERSEVELFKVGANSGEHFSLNPGLTSQCLETEDSGNYVEMTDTSNTNPTASTTFRSSVTETSLPTSNTTISTDIVSTCTTAIEKEKQKGKSQHGMHKTPVGYVLEEKTLGVDNTIGDNKHEQVLMDIWNCERNDSDSDNSFVEIEEDED